jgi:flagellar biosynthesis/type III secretory pathway chaperone
MVGHMQISQDISQQLLLLLKNEIKHAGEMLNILQQENTALRKNDIIAFEEVLEAKHKQAELLDEFERKIDRIGNMPDALKPLSNCVAFIERNKNNILYKTWEELQDTLRQCQTQNIINNRIMESSKLLLQESLNILHGGNGATPTYKSSGKTETNSSGGSLAFV